MVTLLLRKTLRFGGLGLLLAALWLQLIAPALMLRMDALAADPLNHEIICEPNSGEATQETQAAAPISAMPGCGHCALCSVGAATPVLPEPPRHAHTLFWTCVQWPIPPPAFSPSISRLAGQPRAPPVLA